MRPSWHIARHALSGRRARTILLTVAVTLAAALVTAVSTGVRTVQATVEYRISRSIGNVDARIIHRYGSPFEAEIAEEVRSWPEVRQAAPRMEGALTLARLDDRRDKDGRRLRITAQARGVDTTRDEAFAQYDILEGRMPSGPSEILIDPLTGDSLQVTVGDRLRVERFGPPIELEIVGIRDRPILGALQKPRVQVDTSIIEEAIGRQGRASLVSILLEEGVDVPAWVQANEHRISSPLLLEAAERARAGYDRQVRASRVGFRVGVMVSFLACAFIVAIGMTTAIGEQVRQLAMLRCVGASRGQLALSQALVGLLIGGIGGVIGAPIGIGLAGILRWWYDDLLPGGLAVPLEGVLLSIFGAVAAGLLGAAWPAYRAASTTPLEALANRAKAPNRTTILIMAGIGICLALFQVSLLSIPDSEIRFLVYGFVGLPAVHIAYFLLAVPVFAVLAPMLARPVAAIFRLPITLVRGNLADGVIRLGLTAGALMVGLSVLVSTWSNGLALVNDFRERVKFADGFVMKTGGLGEEEQAFLRTIPGVVGASPVGYLPLRVAEQDRLGTGEFAPPNVVCVGFVPEEFLSFNRVDWIQGSPEVAIPRLSEGDAVLVAKEFLVARELGVGDIINLGAEGDEHPFEIVGVVGAAGLDMATGIFGIRSVYLDHAVSCVFMDFEVVAERFGTREAFIMQLDLELPTDPAEADAAETEITEIVREEVPGAIFASGRSIKTLVDEIGGRVLAVTTSIATAALLLACLGVGNVVAAGITARGYEFGVLRAVGGSPGTAPRLVLAEITVTGIAAAITGTALGIHLAWIGVLMYEDLAGINLELSIPVLATSIGAMVVVASALLASIPASWSLLRKPPRALLATGRAG